MLTDGLRLTEGSSIINAAVAAGTTFPTNADEGELFFRSDLNALHVFTGTQWEQVGQSSATLEGQTGSYYLDLINATGVLDIEKGGTAATTAAAARTNLGLAIGTNVQAFDADLTAIGALAGTSGLLRKTAANTWSLDTTSYLSTAGGTMTGNLTMTGSIIPSANITYDLGSPTMMWKDIYVGPGSIYMNGQKILENVAQTIIFSADDNQNVRVETGGTGTLELQTAVTGTIAVKSTMTITAGKKILDSNGIQVEFGDNIEMGTNKVTGLGAPTNPGDATNKAYVDALTGNDGTIVRTTGDQTIAGNKTFSGNVVINGSFSANGGIAMFADNILEFNADFTTGAPTEDAGFQIRRGDLGIVRLLWDETNDRFALVDASMVGLPLFTSSTVTAQGGFVGNASTATALATGRTLSVSGDAIGTSAAFTGAANASIPVTLATVNSNVGTFGSSTQVPVLTVNAKGLVTAVSQAPITTSFGITGDVSGTIDGGTDVLTLATVNSNVGSFGSAAQIPTFTVNSKGLVTAAGSVSVGSISIDEGQITDGSIFPRLAANETITGAWTFTGSPLYSSVAPGIQFNESDRPVGGKRWLLVADGGLFQVQTREDDGATNPITAFSVSRAGAGQFIGPVTAAAPTASGHLTTKAYVDGLAQGLQSKPSVRAATTANLTATYNNGTAGVGATLTFAGALPTIDTVTLAVGNGVLVKNQTAAAQNGRYQVTQLNPGILTRCTLCDEASEIPGAYAFVTDGTLANSGWVQGVDNPATFVIGTDAITMTQFSATGSYTAGAGLDLSGTTFSLLPVGNASTYRSVTTNAYGQVTAGTNPTTLAGYGITDALLKTGDTFTGQLNSNIGGGAPSSNAHISLINGSGYNLSFNPRTAAGAFNTMAQAGDAQIVYAAGTIDAASALVIGPWSSTAKGLRIDSVGDVTFANKIIGSTLERTTAGVLTLNSSNAAGTIDIRTAGASRMTVGSNGTVTVIGANLNVGGGNALLIQHDGTNAYMRAIDGGTLHLGSGAVNTMFLTTLGANVTGLLNVSSTLSVGSSGNGSVALTPGEATRTGFINFFAANGNRQGYIGYSNTTTVAETGTVNYVAGTHAFSGTVAGAFSGSLTGNASSATRLINVRTIALSGAATGTATGFDGTANISIPVTSLNAPSLSGVVPNASISGAYNGFSTISASGSITSASEFVDTSGAIALRMKNAGDASGIAFLVYSDPSDFYLLLTNNNDANGSWNGLRPFIVNKSTGNVTMQHNLGVGGTITGSLVGNVTGSVSGNASSATLAAKASTLSAGGGNGTAMTFNWAGQGGQPSWLWGGNDGANMFVYNPSNFSVNYANSAGSASTATTATNSTQLGGASADDFLRYRGQLLVADVNSDRLPGVYDIQNSGDSDLLLEFRSINSSPRLQIVANYADELYFRVARDARTQFDGIGHKDKRILHTGIFNPFNGAGASGTWGINISGSAANLGGYAASVSNVANTIPVRDGNGYTYFNYLNSNTNNNENGTVSQVIITNGSDNFYRKASVGHLTASLSGTAPINITGNAGNTSSISNAVGGAYTWTGVNGFSGTSSVGASGRSGTLECSTTGSVNDSATMSFHRNGFYAINMGLDPDGTFRMGGWSDGAGLYRWAAQANGDFLARGAFFPGNQATRYMADAFGLYGSVGVTGNKNGFTGVSCSNNGFLRVTGMIDGNGNGGEYEENAGNWITYWNRDNACLGLGGVNTTSGYRAQTNGSHFVQGNLDAAGQVYGGSMQINSNAPTLSLRDTDNLSAFLHVNGNLIYFLRGNGVNATSWDSGPNNRHPMTMNMNNGNVEFSGDITAFSDIRLKKNITTIEGALEKVETLRGVTFDHVEQGRGTGLIAQELQEVLPEAVHESADNGYLTVAYGNTVGLLVEAIKELSAQNKALLARLEALEAKE